MGGYYEIRRIGPGTAALSRRAMLASVPDSRSARRLEEASRAARAAEARGADAVAGEDLHDLEAAHGELPDSRTDAPSL